MTASSTRRSRSLSSDCDISVNVLTTSERCQVGGERVEPQPAIGSQGESSVLDPAPAGADPGHDVLGLTGRELEAAVGAKSEVDALGGAILLRQDLVGFARVLVCLDSGRPGVVRSNVPA